MSFLQRAIDAISVPVPHARRSGSEVDVLGAVVSRPVLGGKVKIGPGDVKIDLQGIADDAKGDEEKLDTALILGENKRILDAAQERAVISVGDAAGQTLKPVSESATAPVYLTPQSLSFAGVSTACAVIAGFVHNAMNVPVLEVAVWTGGIVGAFLILIGFVSKKRQDLTPQFIVETVGVGAINAALLVITIYGAISVVQTTSPPKVSSACSVDRFGAPSAPPLAAGNSCGPEIVQPTSLRLQYN